jgi:hypothetical protein
VQGCDIRLWDIEPRQSKERAEVIAYMIKGKFGESGLDISLAKHVTISARKVTYQ